MTVSAPGEALPAHPPGLQPHLRGTLLILILLLCSLCRGPLLGAADGACWGAGTGSIMKGSAF